RSLPRRRPQGAGSSPFLGASLPRMQKTSHTRKDFLWHVDAGYRTVYTTLVSPQKRRINLVTERLLLPLTPPSLVVGYPSADLVPVVAYIRGPLEMISLELERLRRFSQMGGLRILEEYVEEGRPGEGFVNAFHRLAQEECPLLVPHLDVL